MLTLQSVSVSGKNEHFSGRTLTWTNAQLDYTAVAVAALAQYFTKIVVPINHLQLNIWENKVQNTRVVL